MIKAIMATDDKGGVSKGKSMPWPKNSNDLQWFKKKYAKSSYCNGEVNLARSFYDYTT